jgi:DUF1680 family protein
MKTIFLGLLSLFILVSAAAQIHKDELVSLALNNVKVGGEIGRRIQITVNNNLLQINADKDFLAPFKLKNCKKAGYIGLGKLIDATVKLASYTGDLRVIALKNHLVDEIIKAQEIDGYLGLMASENRMWMLWDIHEMGYIIFGLINDYNLFGNKQSLAAAKKGADYIIKNWSSMPEGWEYTTNVGLHVAITGIDRTMLTLYNITHENRYLDFCLKQHLIKSWDPGIVIGRRNLIEGHIYGYMAASLAQLELYRIQPDENLLIPAMKAINFITANNGLTISGGVGQVEIWTNDQDGRGDLGETCSTAYQLRVYDNLLRLKGDSRYGDIMERTIYNALFGAQSPDGRQIRYFTPFEGNRVWHNTDTYCCPCNYRRIVSELPAMIYYQNKHGIAINLYSQSNTNIKFDDGVSVVISQETDYPNSGHVVIRIDPSKSAFFPLKLRIPLWCKNASVLVNNKPSGITCIPGEFANLERVWNPGDMVTLEMPMGWRLVRGRERQAGRVAVMRGPLVFCLNPDQEKSFDQMDAADIGRITIDLKSIDPVPVPNNAVRPAGIGCRLKAGSNTWAMDNAGNIGLTLTEFADPKGKNTYFRIPDLSEAVDDELIGLKLDH